MDCGGVALTPASCNVLVGADQVTGAVGCVVALHHQLFVVNDYVQDPLIPFRFAGHSVRWRIRLGEFDPRGFKALWGMAGIGAGVQDQYHFDAQRVLLKFGQLL